MDDQLVNDYYSATTNVRSRQLHEECDELEMQLHELESNRERKSTELIRLRRTLKNERALKQSALTKLAQIDFGLPNCTASMISSAVNSDHRSADHIESIGNNGSENSNDATAGSVVVDQDLQRRLLELELELVSKERENITKHKTVIDHYENVMEEKRNLVNAIEEEIRRMRTELGQKQIAIDQLRREKGLEPKSPSSNFSAVSSK